LLSIIIPALNEAHALGATLDAVAQVRGDKEVIVVDGGSLDSTVEVARERGAQVVKSERGRGAQMHAGACVAQGEVFWFLHADTIPPAEAAERIFEALKDTTVVGGNFDVRFDGERYAARFLTWLYPRLRRLGLCYGDSAIFVRREDYKRAGGFQPFPIFEDLDLIRQLRRRGPLVHLPTIVTTSSRRFEGRSFALTFTRWAMMQGLYWLGVHPSALGRLYAPIRGARFVELERGETDDDCNHLAR
jgi:rSAM/selenodomain-associated transferase 2